MASAWTDGDRDRVRARLVEAVAALPGVVVEDSHGHTGFMLRGKRFAWLLVDHHGDGRLGLCAKAPPGEQAALVGGDPERYFVPAYLGASGWVGVNLDDAAKPDWAEVSGLLEQAWRMSAGKRAIDRYDAEQAS